MSAKRFLKLFTISFTIAVFTILTITAVASAADRYWVGGTGSVSDNGTHWSASSGGAPGASLPTSSDDVYFDANSFTGAGQVVTIDIDLTCASINFTGVTNNPTYYVNGDKETKVYGNITLANTVTYTKTGSGYIFATYQNSTIRSNSAVIGTNSAYGAFRHSYATILSLADDLSINGLLVFGNTAGGTITTNNFDITVTGSLAGSYANAKTWNLGSSTIECGTFSCNALDTMNAGTSTIISNGNFTGAGKTFNDVILDCTGDSTPALSGANTYVDLTINGTASKTDVISITAGNTQTVNGICSINGNSSTNRLLVQTDTLGTSVNITVGAVNITASNVDFMDITATNAVDLSAITGGSGDCGGNTGITFTPAATQTSSKASTWDDSTMWTSRVPLPQDPVSCSHDVTVNMPRIGGNITFTGTPTISLSNTINNYGSFTLPVGCTYTYNTYSNTFRGRGEYLLNTGNKNLYAISLYTPNGKITLNSNLTLVYSGSVLQIYNGTFDANDYNVTGTTTTAALIATFGTGNKIIYMGDGTWTSYATAAVSKWYTGGSNLTIYSENSTILLSSTANNAQTFDGGGFTYNDIQVAGAGDYTLTITGSNTFNDIDIDASGAAKTIDFTDGTTQIVNDITRDCLGTNVITFNGTAAAGWALNITNANPIWLDYLAVEYGTANTTIYAGNNSVDGGSNTGWSFVDPALTTVSAGATGITMDMDGVTGGTIAGNITASTAGTPWITTWFEYGETVAYGTNTTSANQCSYNQFTASLPTNLTPGQTYHYRSIVQTGNGTFTGSDDTFTFTMPTVTTAAISELDIVGTTEATLNGNVTDLGVATGCYRGFNYGESTSYGTNTTESNTLATGTYDDDITGFDYDITLHARGFTRVGTVYSYGSDQSIAVGSRLETYGGLDPIVNVLPVIVLVAFVAGGGVLSFSGVRNLRADAQIGGFKISLGILFIGVGIILYNVVIASVDVLRTGAF